MKTFSISMLIILLFLCMCPGLFAENEAVSLSFERWDIGKVKPDTVYEKLLVIRNNLDTGLDVVLQPAGGGFKASPANHEIPSRDEAAFVLTFDTSGSSGRVSRQLTIKSPQNAFETRMVHATAILPDMSAVGNNMDSDGKPEQYARSGVITADLYYTFGCHDCEELIDRMHTRLRRDYGLSLEIKRYDILVPENHKAYLEAAGKSGSAAFALPALKIGNLLLQGKDEIEAGLMAVAEKGGAVRANRPAGPGQNPVSFSILPVFFAGLLDGVNPCVFATLLFLISYLAVAGRTKRELVIIGVLYTVSVFITYTLIGFGLFHFLRAWSGYSWFAGLIDRGLIAVLCVLALLSFYDAGLAASGRSGKMLLKLPGAVRNQLRTNIREKARSSSIIAGTLILGFTVSLFELACTGQVYFPTLAYMVQERSCACGIRLLLVYNAAFVIPLIIVFVAVYKGLTSRKLEKLAVKSAFPVKMALGILFLAIAALLVLL